MFDNEFPPLGGGTGVVNYHLLKEMAGEPDLWVDLLTSSRSRYDGDCVTFSDRIRIYKVPVDNLNIHHATNRELVRYSRRALRLAYRLLTRHHYDLSFAFAGVPAGALSYALNMTHKLPYLVSLQGPDVPGFEARYKYLYPILTPLLRRIWRRAAVVTAISSEQTALAHHTMPGLPIVTIPNGVDTAVFCPHAREAQQSTVVILCVARLIERKGQHHLLRAFAELRKTSTSLLQLLLVGTGDAHRALLSLAEELGVVKDVTFAGFVPREDMPAVYRKADIFVLPSAHEGMSIALLEAMASGLPVIVTDTGGTTELVTCGRNGEIVPWGDTRALSKALRTMINDRSMREAMGVENRERVLPFGWRALAKRYTDLCTRVAAGASASEVLSSSRQAASSIRVWTKER